MKRSSSTPASRHQMNRIEAAVLWCAACAFDAAHVFDNAFVFQDIKIEIINNPVTGEEIEFAMIGSKKHECASTRVYGTAYDQDHNMITLDRFTKQYVRNTRPGEAVPNTWSLKMPNKMTQGDWRVSITGDFLCNYLIFQTEKSQTYDNILLVVE